jgi:hypothetical protein
MHPKQGNWPFTEVCSEVIIAGNAIPNQCIKRPEAKRPSAMMAARQSLLPKDGTVIVSKKEQGILSRRFE